MAIDFTFPPEIEEIRTRTRRFMQEGVAPIDARDIDRDKYYRSIGPLCDAPASSVCEPAHAAGVGWPASAASGDRVDQRGGRVATGDLPF